MLHRILQVALRAELPATLVYDYPTVSAIIDYVSTRTTDHSAAESTAVRHVAAIDTEPFVHRGPTGRSATLPALALTALASRTSKDAVTDLAGRDTSTRVPFSHWDMDAQQEVRVVQKAHAVLCMSRVLQHTHRH